MEGLKVSDAKLVVYVHPSKATKVSQAILRELSSLLFKFSEIFDGVVLAYDVSTLSEVAKILPGVHPYFGVRLQAKLLLFHPKTDMLLEGKVVKLGQQSIHVIVLGFSSASIIEEDIREEFKYKVKRGEEVFDSASHKRHKIKVGTTLRFLVKRSSKKRKKSEEREQMSEHNKSIIDASTLSMNTDQSNKKSKKRRRNEDS
ncbi:DNA-directed RNA polymerase [Actinidia rufa]|uniref:DNA-directed RNA polymerase subunit n=1 Tax=Actinidia rufa TaxID=165716 RepID=A0A7J0DK97_9ERIC|nr:DNA-directed RNA polymerase [Actinidia rufa]